MDQKQTVRNDHPAKGSGDSHVFVIKPTEGWRFLNFRELWEYRELVYFLVWRGVKVRYKQTTIGVAWAVLQPIAMMAVFAVFFGKLAKLPSEGIPYPAFILAALLPWQFFARTLGESANSLIADQRLITKIYFPRIIIPLTTVIVASLDFLIAGCLLVILLLMYGIVPGATITVLPVFILLMFVASLGIGFWLAALNVEYRDVTYVVPFFTQLLFFLTPVVYPSSMIPGVFRILYSVNPMVGVVEGFRWALFGVGEGFSWPFIVSAAVALLVFVTGILWFGRLERRFVDSIGS
jgi:lipopolysaccharide transport system permease protein